MSSFLQNNYQLIFNTTAESKLIYNPPVGGQSPKPKKPVTLLPSDRSAYVIGIYTYEGQMADAWGVAGIRLYWNDGTDGYAGWSGSNTHTSVFTFRDGEKITDMTIWAGWNIDKIEFRTSHGREFISQGTRSTNHSVGRLGNGNLVGLNGMIQDPFPGNNDLVSIGPIFQG